MLLGTLPAAAARETSADAVVGPDSLPQCGTELATARTDAGARTDASARTDSVVVAPWRSVLDDDGVVAEHRVTLRNNGVDTIVRTGPRGFAVAPTPGRLLIGERSNQGTRLVMVDTQAACRVWVRSIPQLAYDVAANAEGTVLRFAAHEPESRRYEGDLEIDAETGTTNAMIDGQCVASCTPNDGEVTDAAFMPASWPRPVPAFGGGGWGRDKILAFSWQVSNVPPVWARPALVTAASDASGSSIARSPTFRYGSSATNSVRYTSTFPSFCRFGIACASRAMPAWAVWIRPHGTDFSWGTLRWCERTNTDGCFDLRRVMLHELGHIAGLNHPSTAGFTLAPYETVMHAITPARPKPSSRRHVFGRCDVATLQELYDLPGSKALVSSCNDVATVIDLEASRSIVSAGGSVELIARLAIADRAEYGLMRRQRLAGRSVKLRYRSAGSGESWSTTWMRPLAATGRYAATISPHATWEFKAVFPAPSDEGLRFSGSSIVNVKVKP